MIERIIFNALSSGIENFKKNPDLISTYFTATKLLEQKEALSARDKFIATPPSVIHHYARADSSFPLYSIILLSQNESLKFLNDEGFGLIGGDDEMLEEADMSSIYTDVYGILSYSEHPDVCRYNYELAKFLLTRARPFFKSEGLLDTQFSGNDIAPDSRYIPAHLFVRQLTMQAQKEECVVGEAERRAFKIAGLHFDGGGLGSPTPIGVDAMVTVSNPED